MTDADRPMFAQAVARLAVALGEPAPDAAMLLVYFRALNDLEIEFVVAAAEQSITRAQWFPKTSEWRTLAVKIEADRLAEQRAILRKLPAPLCLTCNDTGWKREANDRVNRCECQRLRRLEVLGKRPMPMLPEAPLHGRDDAIGSGEAKSLLMAIERHAGVQMAPRAMPVDANPKDHR
jgi:hypothetical protein